MFIPKETNVEKLVREYVPGFFVSTSVLMNRFNSYSQWGGKVIFNQGKYVTKNICRQGRVFRKEMNQAIPDFILVDKRQELNIANAIQNAYNNKPFTDPFPSNESFWYCEIFGSYWHSQKQTGLPEKEHEKQVKDAYESIGAKVLILWENDVVEHWESIAKPQLNEFIKSFVDSHEVDFNFSINNFFQYTPEEVNCFSNFSEFSSLQPEDQKWFLRKCKKHYFMIQNLYSNAGKEINENDPETPEVMEGYSFVKCKLCGATFRRLGSHLKKIHKQTVEDYQKRFPGSPIICKEEQKRIAQTNSSKYGTEKRNYTKRVAYLLPDGTYTGITHKYKKEWKTDKVNPCHIFDAQEVGYISQAEREFLGIEGIDFVSCKICGVRKGNLTQHLRRAHGLSKEDYKQQYHAEIYSQKAKESQHLCTLHRWETLRESKEK